MMSRLTTFVSCRILGGLLPLRSCQDPSGTSRTCLNTQPVPCAVCRRTLLLPFLCNALGWYSVVVSSMLGLTAVMHAAARMDVDLRMATVSAINIKDVLFRVLVYDVDLIECVMCLAAC